MFNHFPNFFPYFPILKAPFSMVSMVRFSLPFALEALSSAWAKLNEAQRKPFEASALIDRCRKEISELRGAKLKAVGMGMG